MSNFRKEKEKYHKCRREKKTDYKTMTNLKSR